MGYRALGGFAIVLWTLGVWFLAFLGVFVDPGILVATATVLDISLELLLVFTVIVVVREQPAGVGQVRALIGRVRGRETEPISVPILLVELVAGSLALYGFAGMLLFAEHCRRAYSCVSISRAIDVTSVFGLTEATAPAAFLTGVSLWIVAWVTR
jgi:hypothetical protein